MITREVFEEEAKPVLDRLLAPVQKVGGKGKMCCVFEAGWAWRDGPARAAWRPLLPAPS